MHDLQAIHTELLRQLNELDSVCQRHGIPYTLHGGTLLGAVRERGFIPWDDDVDVTLTREAYERLRAVFDAESDEYCLFEDFLHMPRIVKRRVGPGEVFAWSDIILYDPISEKKIPQKAKILGVLFFQAMLRTKHTIRLSRGKGHGALRMVVFYLAYLVGKLFPYRAKMRWYNRFCANAFVGKRELIHRSNDQLSGVRICLPKACMECMRPAPFEDTTLQISERYHDILVTIFGENYMTPVQDMQREDMHVKFRREFLRTLRESGRVQVPPEADV